MPCESRYSDQDHARELKQELDETTRFLCTVLGAIGDAMRAPIFEKLPELREWYAKHLRADQDRLRREQEEQQRKELKTQALSKLSTAEREALGLRR